MQTRVIKVEEDNFREAMEEATKLLAEGELVGIPTETVYGLAASAYSNDAVDKIFKAKGRPQDNPLIVHISDMDMIDKVAVDIPEKAYELAEKFWPGPLTMILPKSDLVPPETSGGLSTVAVRMPSHPVANALLRSTRVPIAAPSANLSGRPSPTKVSHVIEDMDGRIDAIVDGGDVGIGLESTIVDLSQEVPVLLRPGYITVEMLSAELGEVLVDPAITREAIIHHKTVTGAPKAPGMKYRHYAPRAPLTVVYGEPVRVAEAISRAADEKTAVIAPEEHVPLYTRGMVLPVGRLSDPESIARALFDVLRECDTLQAERIYAEDLTASDIGGAVMNRLLKAAGGSFISEKDL